MYLVAFSESVRTTTNGVAAYDYKPEFEIMLYVPLDRLCSRCDCATPTAPLPAALVIRFLPGLTGHNKWPSYLTGRITLCKYITTILAICHQPDEPGNWCRRVARPFIMP